MVRGRIRKVGIIVVEGKVQSAGLEEIPKEKSALSEDNNENDLLWGRRIHLGDEISKKRLKMGRGCRITMVYYGYGEGAAKGKRSPL